MAYSITYTPGAFTSVQEDVIYTVSEPSKTVDSITYPNYKFIADIYIDGTQVARLKRVPHPITKIGIFNVSQIVRSYVTAIFNPGSDPSTLVTEVLGEGNFKRTVTIKFGEEYGFVSYLDIAEDTDRVLFNHYNGRLVAPLSALTAKADKLASDRPVFELFADTNLFMIPYFPTTTSTVNITVTPVGGGIPFASSFAPDNAYDLHVLNFSPVILNAAQPGTINASTKYYTVTVGSQSFRVNVICEARHETYPLHFLNKYGGFETKIFTKASRTNYDIDRKDYGMLAYEVKSDGSVTTRNLEQVYHENRPVYSVDFKEKLTLNSDFLTDAEYQWLLQLLVSPMVYIEFEGFYFPVVITNSSYETKKFINDDLTNLTIDIEYGSQYNAQYR